MRSAEQSDHIPIQDRKPLNVCHANSENFRIQSGVK